MFKMNKYFVILVLFSTVVSCKSESKQTNSNQDAVKETISIVDTLPLKLNVNKKWIANVETHKGVSKMDSILSSFKSNSKKDYKVLGDLLSKQTSYIIQNCSMTGEPHDQLHVVLIPMLDEISILREENNEVKAELSITNLEALIKAYFKFFEER